MRRSSSLVVFLAAVLMFVVPVQAAKKDRKTDQIWTHPEFATFGVERIAMLPAATYDGNLTTEKQVEGSLGQALKDAGYRWLSATSTRALLRDAETGDSLLRVAKEMLLEQGRVDSASAPALCAKLRCRALLTVRVEQWERRELEWNQSGTPTTTVRLTAALVDSTGTLLWRAAGSETVEGPYQDARANPIGLTGGSLERKPITGQGGAPDYVEVVTTLTQRWGPLFPARVEPESD